MSAIEKIAKTHGKEMAISPVLIGLSTFCKGHTNLKELYFCMSTIIKHDNIENYFLRLV